MPRALLRGAFQPDLGGRRYFVCHFPRLAPCTGGAQRDRLSKRRPQARWRRSALVILHTTAQSAGLADLSLRSCALVVSMRQVDAALKLTTLGS